MRCNVVGSLAFVTGIASVLWHSRATYLGAALLSSLVLSTSCQQASYFSKFEIDSNLHFVITGPIYAREPVGSFYAPSYGPSGTSIDHYEKATDTRDRSLYLEMNDKQVLDRTVKYDEVLKGPFGAVNATRTCSYSRPIQNVYSSVYVEYNANETEHERPAEILHPPSPLPALTSFSLVRIFVSAPGEYAVISASYERNGHLGTVSFGSGKAGNRGGSGTAFFPEVDPAVEASANANFGPSLVKYGIPTRVDLELYLHSGRMLLPKVELEEEKTVLMRFYDFGKLIRQDELKSGFSVSSRWLQPSTTAEERETLNALCDARFRQQQALGLPTVR